MRRLVLPLAACAAFAAAPAHAADFTFKVPINLSDYSQPANVVGASQTIECHVYKTVPGGAMDVGNGKTILSIPASGNLNTTVSVEVNAAAPNKPQDVTMWRCWFMVSTTPPVKADDALAGGTLKPKGGTTPVLNVAGTLSN